MDPTIYANFTAQVSQLFTGKKDPLERKLHAAVGVASEAGELLDALKKTWVYGKELDYENILEECGDALFYMTALLNECGFTLQDAMEHNVAKLRKRYPNGFSQKDAIARADKQ